MKGIQFKSQNSRDFIVSAARNLHNSKWQQAFKDICSIKIFSKLRGFVNGHLKEALLIKVKEVAMKIFIIESQAQHESFSIN